MQRHQDAPTNANVDNTTLFDASIAALNEEKRVLLLFPEGVQNFFAFCVLLFTVLQVSYTESQMQPLKTGAARVAQEYHAKHKSKFEEKFAVLVWLL